MWIPLYLISTYAKKSQLERGQLKFNKVWNKKKGVWKRGKQALKEAEFSK